MNTTICFTGKDWIGESCPRKGAAQAKHQSVRVLSPTLARVICFCVGHDWFHCTCQRCDKVRDEAHDWVLLEGETCKAKCCLCGLPNGLHDYADGVCRHCGDQITRNPNPVLKLNSMPVWKPPPPGYVSETGWTAH
jgi:hypothetical protein